MKALFRILLIALALGLTLAPAQAFTIATTAATNAPMTGLWNNPAEPGWGVSIQQQGPIMFVGWYTYDNNGNSTRYVMSNCAVSGDHCTGDITYIAGGAAPTAPWTGRPPSSTVGTGTITFSDTNTGVINFTLNGVAGSKSISRFVFASLTPPPPIDFTGCELSPLRSHFVFGVKAPADFRRNGAIGLSA